MDRLLKKILDLRFEIAAVFLSCYGFFLRASCLWSRELWGDEKYSLKCILGPIKPLLWVLDPNGEQTCFPGYYYVTWPFAELFKTSKWGINIPHILITVIGFYFFYLLCRRHLRSFFAFTVAFLLFMCNQNLVFHAFEFRPYAVLPTLAIGLLFFSERLMDGVYEQWWQKFFLFLLFAFSVFYHPYGLLMSALTLGYVLVRDRSLCRTGRWKACFIFAAITLCLLTPVFLWYASGTVWDISARGIDVFEYIANPAVNGVQFMRDVFGNLTGKPLYCKALVVGVLPFILFVRSRWSAYFIFMGIFIIIPIQLILVSDLQRQYWFLQRQFVWVTPYFAFLVGWIWNDLFQRSKIDQPEEAS
jgi:hypothetical protein